MIERYSMIVHDMVVSNLKFRGIEFIDLTDVGGGLYFFDKTFADDLKAGHYDVRYARNGTRRTRRRPAWYMVFDCNDTGEQLQPSAAPASDHENHAGERFSQPVHHRKKKKKLGIPVFIGIIVGIMLIGSANTNFFTSAATAFYRGKRAASHSKSEMTTALPAQTLPVSPSAPPTFSQRPLATPTWRASLSPGPSSSPTPFRITATPRPTHAGTPEPRTAYIVNLDKTSHKMHLPDCQDVKRMANDNYEERIATYSELRAQGFSACGHCMNELYQMERHQKDNK